MKLREKFRRFWTMDVHNHEGFTLVELIIVIAILAILSSVAVVGYSSYVEKANKQADMTLIAEIENALMLHYYSATTPAAGYVVLYADGTVATADGAALEAMQDAYGANWNEQLKLQFKGWTDDGMLSTLLKGNVANIANSSYMQNADSEELLGTVTTLTQAATQAFAAVGGTDDQLKAMMGQDFMDKLATDGITKEDPDYNTIVSNMMVTHIADEFTGDPSQASMGSQLAHEYAMMYAFALTNPDAMKEMEKVNDDLAKAKSTDDLWNSLNFSDEFAAKYTEYVKVHGGNNSQAFVDIMTTVDSVSAQLTDYSDPNLYSSEQVSNMLKDYSVAVKSIAALNLTEVQKAMITEAVKNGGVVILLSSNGTVAAFPTVANSRN